MALRSVVVQPPPTPPGPRRTVVLRAGGPASRGHWLDLVIGILGVLLIVAAVALGQLLPDRTYLNPQFRFSGADVTVEGSTDAPSFYFEEAGVKAHDFVFLIPEDNVKSVSLSFGFVDDISFSLPDRFVVELFAPNGTFMGRSDLQNDDPRGGANATAPPEFSVASKSAVFPTAPGIQEQIVTGLTHTELPEQVLARLAPSVHVANAGEWVVRVTLIAAQDCPGPGQGYPTQAIDCRVQRPDSPESDVAPDGVDPGNVFRITQFVYTYYLPQIEELK